MDQKYDVNYLVQVVNDALNEEEWCRPLMNKLPRGYIPAMRAEDAHRWGELTERLSRVWDPVKVACKLLGVDQDTLTLVVKSMNRYEKRGHWNICAHISDEDSFRRFVSDDFSARYKFLYYPSTGRKREQGG